MDLIFMRDFRLEAKIGIYEHERVTTQPIALDLEFALPNTASFASGDVADTIDYGQVAERLRAELGERRFGLVEEMAEFIADMLLNEFGSPSVTVTVCKLGILKDVRQVGITIQRPRPTA
jgi:dihydroneopterin aldolase